MEWEKLIKAIIDGAVVVLVVIMLIVIILLTGGCGAEKVPPMYKDRMEYAGASGRGSGSVDIWIDKETGICYLVGPDGSATVMQGHDGAPYVANGWRDFGSDN